MKAWLVIQQGLYKLIKLVADDWKIPTGIAISALLGISLNALYPNSSLAGIIFVITILITFISIVSVLGANKAS